MTLKQLWELFPVILKEHDPVYFQYYEAQRARLAELFLHHINYNDSAHDKKTESAITENLTKRAEALRRISHIGSTAVPGLISKPTVDILLELNKTADIAAIRKALENDGWLIMSDVTQPALRLSFNKGYTESGFAEEVYHLHVVHSGDHDELYFRDYLIAHPETAAEYGQLKLSLLEKYRHDRDGYTAAKTEFIKKYTAAAREERRK